MRCTKQREELYVALATTRTHPTAEELLNAVRQTEPGLSLATVYNTLDAFEQCGLVRKLPAADGKGPCRFDADLSDHIHVLLPDGRVIDLDADLAKPILDAVGSQMHSRLESRLGMPIDRLSMHLIAHEAPRSECPDSPAAG